MPKGYKGREKTERLHLLASPEEIQAIEDWQFENRISSKGEAIRRLVQIGLRLERELPTLIDNNLAGIGSITDILVKLSPQSARTGGVEQDVRDLVDIVLGRQLDGARHLAMLYEEIQPLARPGQGQDISDALKEASKTRAEVASGRHKLQLGLGPADGEKK
jgi:hypothetical protein